MAPIHRPPAEFQTLTGFRLDSDTAGRGTLGIIYTCWTAILLASWTSFHNKCRKPGDRSRKTKWLYRFNRVLYTFLLPEVAAVWSVRDLLEATRLCGRFMVYQRQLPGWHHFTMKQAFVCIMDGVYMKLPDSDVLEKAGHEDLLWLAYTRQLEYSEYPSGNDIDDKSKSDSTMKFISIVQTLFFVVHIIARLVLHYPVTLLEDMAAAHVFCGIIAFCFWFCCPHNIEQPFIIKPDPSKKVIPVEDPKLSGKAGAQSTVKEITAQEEPVGWFQSMKDLVTSTFAAKEDTTTSVEEDQASANKPQKIELYFTYKDLAEYKKNIKGFRRSQIAPLYMLVLVSTGAFWEVYNKTKKNEEKVVGEGIKDEKLPATEKSPLSEHLKEVQVSSEVSEVIDEGTGRKITFAAGEGFGESLYVKGYQQKQKNRPNLERWAMAFTFMVFLIIHLCAWKYPFPTRGERWTWRICAVTMAISGLGLTKKFYKPKDDRKRMISWLLPRTCIAVYVLSRLAMLGVALSSFRSVPAGIYEVPGWTEFWPHV